MEDFNIDPPDTSDSSGFISPNQQAAVTLELIRLKLDNTLLPDKIKKTIMIDMQLLVNNASMTNIFRGQVREFLGGYNEIWMKYRIFIVGKEHRKELNYLETIIREILIENLNKSIDAVQLKLVFEQHHKYDVKQTRESLTDKSRGIFKRGKQKQIIKEETIE